jgi:hypothetical protein
MTALPDRVCGGGTSLGLLDGGPSVWGEHACRSSSPAGEPLDGPATDMVGLVDVVVGTGVGFEVGTGLGSAVVVVEADDGCEAEVSGRM